MPAQSTWAGLVKNTLTAQDQERIVKAVSANLQSLGLEIIRDRKKLRERATAEVTQAAASLGLAVSPEIALLLVGRAVASVGGLGFFDELLPPARGDLSEIILNPDGKLWVMPKGGRDFEPYAYRPNLDETWRAVEALLSPIGRSLSESVPMVDAKLPRMAGMGGARISVVHPRVAPGDGYPSINVRLFEPKPVTLDQLRSWRMAPDNVLDSLLKVVSSGYRILICGGTATDKTTMLSAIANGIPRTARVVKIEDPEEIWLDHPNVVTLEARPSVPGSDVIPVTVRQCVDRSLRMSPRWLMVGEVRTGDVASALFRAFMSDHPGLSTFHADDPYHAIHRMALIMFTDEDIRLQAAKENFAAAINMLVQIGWLEGRRQVLGIWAVHNQLVSGDVRLEEIYLAKGYRIEASSVKVERIKEIFGHLDKGEKVPETDIWQATATPDEIMVKQLAEELAARQKVDAEE